MLDPHIAGLMQAMAAQGFALPRPLTAAALRGMFDQPMPAPPVEIAEVRDVIVPTAHADLRARLYRDGGAALPLVVFLHGGGFVHGTLDTHDRLSRAIARDAECSVLSLAYRLAPEHVFPAAYEDALAAVRWAMAAGQTLGCDGARVAVAGDSAGGNLAAAVAATLAGEGTVLAHQLLFYPVLDGRCDTASYQTEAPGFLSPDQMRWYWDQYATGADRTDPRASPALAAMSGVQPSATIILAGNDPLHDEGLAYADALRASGTAVTLRDDNGAVHGYVSLFGMIPLADDALATATGSLRAALHR
ncbi:alpha/beta hydrolase [Sphingomonas sp. TDK1]|uniref:alpha/beta hydrolase n=1 Tax=Sphingomonas sp. TDK1 TaxID=453247 RepID=UPI0007D8F580|nr:alpha/beta hydrolase [Sphingomonas sp. TDK1]OAN66675.1 hypothetical protein A7X12_11240 [Sphingomonas sp. TDK1]